MNNKPLNILRVLNYFKFSLLNRANRYVDTYKIKIEDTYFQGIACLVDLQDGKELCFVASCVDFYILAVSNNENSFLWQKDQKYPSRVAAMTALYRVAAKARGFESIDDMKNSFLLKDLNVEDFQ